MDPNVKTRLDDQDKKIAVLMDDVAKLHTAAPRLRDPRPASPAEVAAVIANVQAFVEATYPGQWGLYALPPAPIAQALTFQDVDGVTTLVKQLLRNAGGKVYVAWGSEGALVNFLAGAAQYGTELPMPTDDLATFTDDPATILANADQGIAPAGNLTLGGDKSTFPAQLAARKAAAAVFAAEPAPPGWEKSDARTRKVLAMTGAAERVGTNVYVPQGPGEVGSRVVVPPAQYLGTFEDVCKGIWKKPGT